MGQKRKHNVMSPETQPNETANGQTPNANANEKEIRTRTKQVLDLDSKETVPVLKIGKFNPVTTMEEFVQRLANDSALILKVVNDGLVEHAKELLESDASIPFVVLDEEDKPTPAPANLLIFGSEDKEKSFAGSVLNLAKMLFDYPDVPRGTKLSADEAKANREKKATAKAKAIEMILSNPSSLERLKNK